MNGLHLFLWPSADEDLVRLHHHLLMYCIMLWFKLLIAWLAHLLTNNKREEVFDPRKRKVHSSFLLSLNPFSFKRKTFPFSSWQEEKVMWWDVFVWPSYQDEEGNWRIVWWWDINKRESIRWWTTNNYHSKAEGWKSAHGLCVDSGRHFVAFIRLWRWLAIFIMIHSHRLLKNQIRWWEIGEWTETSFDRLPVVDFQRTVDSCSDSPVDQAMIVSWPLKIR